jgi:hypothetical protein
MVSLPMWGLVRMAGYGRYPPPGRRSGAKLRPADRDPVLQANPCGRREDRDRRPSSKPSHTVRRCQHRRRSRRCPGNRRWRCRHMWCLGQRHSHWRQPERCRSIFPVPGRGQAQRRNRSSDTGNGGGNDGGVHSTTGNAHSGGPFKTLRVVVRGIGPHRSKRRRRHALLLVPSDDGPGDQEEMTKAGSFAHPNLTHGVRA